MDQALKKINTLTELQEEKARLRQEISISKKELMRALDLTRSEGKRLIVSSLLLPAGVVGLAATGVKIAKALRSQPEQAEETSEAYLHYSANPPNILESVKANLAANSRWYIRILPIAIQLISRFLANRRNDQREEAVRIDTYSSEETALQNRS